jgi:site-specific DNA recombinase
MITDGRTKTVRCAVYCRKSTDEGLDQEFNSLDAQREGGEAFVVSQKSQGWVLVDERYEDGGYSGGTIERPALRRLLQDIEAGKIDCVIVYKVDRLSRSLLDFSRLMETFDEYDVAFVSVTQSINTKTSSGRLMLNILLSFAQYEREIISERTRDKMSAARRKGHFVGGSPPLGYDLKDGKLVVNEEEADRVRSIFSLYLESDGLLQLARQLNERGWTTKRWTTKSGKPKGGAPFRKNCLHKMLTNYTYVGKIHFRDEIHEGLHEGIVDPEVFERVGQKLLANRQSSGRGRTDRRPLLGGLLYCSACGDRMVHEASRRKQKRYRYYRCSHATERDSCAVSRISAGELEEAVLEEVRLIVQDPELLDAVIESLQSAQAEQCSRLAAEIKLLNRELGDANRELRKLAGQPDATERIADLNEQIARLEQRLAEFQEEEQRLLRRLPDEGEVENVLDQFDPVWEQLTIRERQDLMHLLVDRIDFDGDAGEFAVTFRTKIESPNQQHQTEEITT